MAIKAQLSPRKKLTARIAGVVLKGDIRMQSKTVSLSPSTQSVRPDPGFDALSFVTVMGIPDAENVAFSATQIDPDVVHSIGYNWFAQVVGHIQAMAGTRQNMTPAMMLYWLGRVKYIPQSMAESSFCLDFEDSASGWLPDVPRGKASSAFGMSFESSASVYILEE